MLTNAMISEYGFILIVLAFVGLASLMAALMARADRKTRAQSPTEKVVLFGRRE